jgi:hypothetical protein
MRKSSRGRKKVKTTLSRPARARRTGTMDEVEFYSLLNTIELLSDKRELAGVMAGLKDVAAGRVQSLKAIEAELAEKRPPSKKR